MTQMKQFHFYVEDDIIKNMRHYAIVIDGVKTYRVSVAVEYLVQIEKVIGDEAALLETLFAGAILVDPAIKAGINAWVASQDKKFNMVLVNTKPQTLAEKKKELDDYTAEVNKATAGLNALKKSAPTLASKLAEVKKSEPKTPAKKPTDKGLTKQQYDAIYGAKFYKNSGLTSDLYSKHHKKTSVDTDMGAMHPSVLNLPGINEKAKHPVTGSLNYRITDIIQDLNDSHGWSREAIADWLETLDVDLTFKTAPKPPTPKKSLLDKVKEANENDDYIF